MRLSNLLFGVIGLALPVGAAFAQTAAPAPTAIEVASLLKPSPPAPAPAEDRSMIEVIAAVDEIRDPVLSSEEEAAVEIALVSAQPLVTLTGRVMDEDNKPLVGATVYVRGVGIAASTDAKGFYSLQVPAGVNKLLFSYGGYADKDLEASNYLPVNVSLAPQTKARPK